MSEKQEVISYKEMIDIIRPKMFGFDKMSKEQVLLDSFHEGINKSYYDALDEFKNMVDGLGLGDMANNVLNRNLEDDKKKYLQDVHLAIDETFRTFTFKQNGFCLKSKLIGAAVQMVCNEDMLGFIREVDDDNTRFVYVDFGGAEESVKIDVDELIIAENI